MSDTMRAMVLDGPGHALRLTEVPVPRPAHGQVLIRVHSCGICRTDLHVVDGELTHPKLPLIPGHQIVGRVIGVGPGTAAIQPGERIGVPWLGWTCGECVHCRRDRENLCTSARFTGYTIDGGFAEFATADARYCFPLPGEYPDLQVAPLLCAGLIGYRALRMTGTAHTLGFYGFGAAAHILIQLARHQGRRVFAFTRHGDTSGQEFARTLGAEWVGDAETLPPEPLEAAILFAPVGSHVPLALRAVEPGGTVVCAGIHMSAIPSFPYELLWHERTVRSVANLTRRDGPEFLALAPRVPVHTEVQAYPLDEVNAALADLRRGQIHGAGVIIIGE
jgi:alcohol dehydrogenase, propanol-preferring